MKTNTQVLMARPRKQRTMNLYLFPLRMLLLIAVCAVVSSQDLLASDPVPAAKQKKPIALVGGTIHTASGDILEKGTVVFDKGKITAVGTNVAIPDGAERIDISGKHVYPGLIDANTIMGLRLCGSGVGRLSNEGNAYS